ncbi:MAG: hypothetical protein AAF771_12225 [Pseudomonadota bacterium]
MSQIHPTPDLHGRPVLLYRWAVFLLAGAATVKQIAIDGDYSDPGGPFRFLTNWALLLAFLNASRMLAFSERRSERQWPDLTAVACVANLLMAGLYWALRFDDPANLRDGPELPAYLDLYLHLFGPLLLWIDAVFIARGFRRPWRSAPWILVLVALYVAWIELVVGPASDVPFGSVTSGLPYPFLNNMAVEARAILYGGIAAAGMAALALFAGLSHAVSGRNRA